MLEKSINKREAVEIINIDERVPKEHMLRKIDKAVNFEKIYELVEDLYCEDNGHPSIGPVVLFKMVLIQPIYGLPSLRQMARDVQVNIAYRWFLGYSLGEEIPHFATVSYNFRHRFTSEIIEKVFEWILFEASKEGYLSPEVLLQLLGLDTASKSRAEATPETPGDETDAPTPQPSEGRDITGIGNGQSSPAQGDIQYAPSDILDGEESEPAESEAAEQVDGSWLLVVGGDVKLP